MFIGCLFLNEHELWKCCPPFGFNYCFCQVNSTDLQIWNICIVTCYILPKVVDLPRFKAFERMHHDEVVITLFEFLFYQVLEFYVLHERILEAKPIFNILLNSPSLELSEKFQEIQSFSILRQDPTKSEFSLFSWPISTYYIDETSIILRISEVEVEFGNIVVKVRHHLHSFQNRIDLILFVGFTIIIDD